MTSLGTTSVSEAMAQSGLDFAIEKLPVSVDVLSEDGVTRMQMPENMGIVARWQDKIVPFRTVGKGYEVIQNTEAFAPLEYLIGEGLVSHIEQAGYTNQGRRVFMLAALSQESHLADPHSRMVMFSTTHDGSGSLVIRGWEKRLFCANQIPMIYKTRKDSDILRIRHSANAKQYMAQTTTAVLAAITQMEDYERNMDVLLNTPAYEGDVEMFLHGMFPNPSTERMQQLTREQTLRAIRNQEEKRETTSRLINGRNNLNITGTAASLFAGAVEWSDYYSRGDNGSRILNGTDVKFKQRAFELASVLTQ